MAPLGRDLVFDYLRDLGVEYMFGVPGSNEIPLIDGTSVPPGNEIAYIPCLHENIAVGAAMGYARLSGKPGVVELHITPGAAHGIGNLYNAYRSHIPVVVLCAQQHSELSLQEPLLWSDIVQTARGYAKWAYEVRCLEELGVVLQRAFKEALAPPSRPVFVSIPWDFTLAEVPSAPGHVTRVGRRFAGDPDEVRRAAKALAEAAAPVIVAGDGVGAAGAWDDIDRLANLVGAPVYSEPLSSYINYPNNLPHWQGELGQTQALQQSQYKGHDVAFLCGYNAQAHVLIYRYENGPLIPEGVTQLYLHDDEWEIGKNDYGEVAILGDIKATLPRLCDEVESSPERNQQAVDTRNAELAQADAQRAQQIQAARAQLGSAPQDALPTGQDVAVALGELQPDMQAPLTLVNESVSDYVSMLTYIGYDRPDAYYFAQGGSLGFSMPFSLGAKLAVGGERTVVNTVGDGSALFYPNTWWTTTKSELAILYVVTNNREYKTLQNGLGVIENLYDWTPSGGPDPWYLRLDQPPVISYVDLARPYGVEGSLVANRGELLDGLRAGLAAVEAGSPYVVEVLTDPGAPPTPPVRTDALIASRNGTAPAVPDAERAYVGPP